jgi:hypothetical protein
MKKDKWLKWKIGAAASLGLALLFHEVKSSPAFSEQTHAAGSGAAGPASNAASDEERNDPFHVQGAAPDLPTSPGVQGIRTHTRTGRS